MMRFLCRLGWHAWPKWGAMQGAEATFGDKLAHITVQYRVCAGCGRSQVREVIP